MRADSSSAETLEPLKKGCGVWLSKRSARRGRVCQGLAAGLDLLVLGVLARAVLRLNVGMVDSDEEEYANSRLFGIMVKELPDIAAYLIYNLLVCNALR